MIELLRPHSRDVWNLTAVGAVERLREVLTAEPRLAKISWQTTPLFWLPEDEQKALEIAKLFLEHGADPGLPQQEGRIDRRRGGAPARHAQRRRTARCRGRRPDDDAARREHLLATYEQLAHDLTAVVESDDEEALDRLGRQFNRILSFDHVRTSSAAAWIACGKPRDPAARRASISRRLAD